MWNYLYFVLYLDTIPENDHNALESYVYKHVSKWSLPSIVIDNLTFKAIVHGLTSLYAKFRASLKSSDALYLIMCKRCGLQYMDETGQPLHLRISNHASI